MDTYSMSSYSLQFNSEYTSLLVVENSNGETEKSFNLETQAWAVSVTDGKYEIKKGNTEGLYYDEIDTDELPLSFAGPNLTGIGTTDIRDMGKAEYEVTYFLEICTGVLKAVNEPCNLWVHLPCSDSNCNHPQSACSSIVQQ